MVAAANSALRPPRLVLLRLLLLAHASANPAPGDQQTAGGEGRDTAIGGPHGGVPGGHDRDLVLVKSRAGSASSRDMASEVASARSMSLLSGQLEL